MRLQHGGQRRAIAKAYGIAEDRWLDLSTGISPLSYPLAPMPPAVWCELPQVRTELLSVAKQYYQCQSLLVTSGSQAIIQALPAYWQQRHQQRGRVWLPQQGYKEHQRAWQNAQFVIQTYSQLPAAKDLRRGDIVVVINPNNPTGDYYEAEPLLALQQALSALGGWLIADEAFADTTPPQQWLSRHAHCDNLFVLRSFGKFFGLAGVRLGFLCAAPEHLAQLSQHLGPWQVNGPALHIGELALADRQWQQQHRQRLTTLANALSEVLTTIFGTVPQGTDLFKTLYLDKAEQWFDALCQQAIYVRLTDEGDALRFGIPTSAQLRKLTPALTAIAAQLK